MESLDALGRLPAFFLLNAPLQGRAELAADELEHATRVLRLGPGDELLGLDGRGGRWVCRLGNPTKGPLEVVSACELELGPGEPGAPLPWIEVAVSWPRRAHGERMLGSLVQLGAAAVTALQADFSGPEKTPDRAPERWHKLAREACKQARRAWLPQLPPRLAAAQLAQERPGALIALLDPHQGMALDTWSRSIVPGQHGVGTPARPIVLAIGPEGGFSTPERETLHVAGATSVRLTPHVLRIETAAVAALAVAAVQLALPPRP